MKINIFSDLLDELEEGDTLVVNNTRVLPARLYGTKEETGAHIEVLLLTNTEGDKWGNTCETCQTDESG